MTDDVDPARLDERSDRERLEALANRDMGWPSELAERILENCYSESGGTR